MNIYAIYAPSANEDIKPLVVKQGFSLNACIFGPFWAIYHKMWLIFFLALFIDALTTTGPMYNHSAVFSLCFSVFKIFLFGFFAAEIREYYAQKSGHNLQDIILATHEEEAELKYYTRIVDSRADNELV